MNSPGRSIVALVSWAAFLACSWTWCIGMFLPILLRRDFGPASIALFLLPNALGAAAMGALAQRAKERIDFRHAGACVAFSSVTIAFQVFFLVLLARVCESWWMSAWPTVGAVAGLALGWRACRGGIWAAGSVAALAVSVSVAIAQADALSQGSPAAVTELTVDWSGWLGLGVVCAIGFLTCPYLDLTFHRARAASGALAPMVFGAGFIGLFPLVIQGTAGTGELLARAGALGDMGGMIAVLPPAIALHMGVQLGFTIGAHVRACDRAIDAPLPGSMGSIAGIGVGGVLGALVMPGSTAYAGLDWPELIYRLFMGFYGLVFPAYILVRVVASHRGWAWFWVTVALASPGYWIGFVERRPEGMLVGAGVLLLSWSGATLRAHRVVHAGPGPR